MASDNLYTASTYINNLLLSRGLLRNGQAIEFARPEKSEEGLESTMGRIMTLVNDLILRRDRDAEQRESLSITIRSLRADILRQTTDQERLQTKHVDAQRRLGLAEATERAIKTQLRSAEQAARGLKEEMARMRGLVNQTRAQCANDIRKRERVIEGLKKHVGEGGRPRGSGKAVGVATINIVTGVGADEPAPLAVNTDESGYDLRMETNEFLTELARGLSEENENLGGLVRRTVETLKTLSGWEREGGQEGEMVVQMDAGYENIAAETDSVIEHLRTLLTNPSFVPLEEVEVREEEIIRLREGWEKMEGRWREAVQLMDGWRKRMAQSGQTVNLEELKQGLRLSPVKVPGIEVINSKDQDGSEIEDEGDTQADINAMDDSQVPSTRDRMAELADETDDDSLLDDEPILEPQHDALLEDSISTASSLSPAPPPPQLSPLREITDNGNRGNNFTTILEENSYDVAHLNYSSSNNENLVQPDEDLSMLKAPSSHNTSSSSLFKPSSRLPRPAPTLPQQSPLTMASIAAKLAATEREADAARVRAKLKAAKLSVAAASATTFQPPPTTLEDSREPSKENLPLASEGGLTRKRKAPGKSHGGRVSRRRSTLSPWELESLILGTHQSPAKVSQLLE